MGEVADMMLEGILCEGCGVYLGDEIGYPRRCKDCETRDAPAKRRPFLNVPGGRKTKGYTPRFACSSCYRSFTTQQGLQQHRKDKHP